MDNNKLLENATRRVLEYAQMYGELKSKYDALKAENERLQQKYQDLANGMGEDFRTLALEKIALKRENAALKEKADKMADVVEGIMSDNHRNEDGSWETPIVISEHLMPYLEQAYSNKEVDNEK
jgi:predicted metalloenzyme YecM